MYTLYVGTKNYSSWSLRPWILMKQLEIAFKETVVNFEGASNWDVFRKFSPSGTVPCLVDSAVVIWDSLAISEYLAETHAAVWPASVSARAWARSAAAEMHSGFGNLRLNCTMNVALRVDMKNPPAGLGRDVDRLDELWSDGLQRFGGPFLAGETFTAVDAFFAPVAFRVQTYGLELTPLAAAYAKRLLALEWMRKWEAAALADPYREASHEQESSRAGVVSRDLRAPAQQ